LITLSELRAKTEFRDEEKARAFVESLADLPIEIEDPTRTRMFVSVLAPVGRYKLTACDASCLELAIRHKLPIAALDNAVVIGEGGFTNDFINYAPDLLEMATRGSRRMFTGFRNRRD
jgi:hypothetical protein